MLIIQASLDKKAMAVLAKVKRKTLRRGRNGPARTLAWFITALEASLAVIYFRGGQSDWPLNALLGLFMMACLLLEDRVNGMLLLRRVPPSQREINAAFQEDSCYVHRTQSGERRYLYQQIRLVAETRDYFILLPQQEDGQIYPKSGFSWGTPEEFREFIHKKTGLKIQTIRQ